MKLSPEKRRFVELLVAGATKADAYRTAFNRNDLSKASAARAGQRLSQREEIVAAMSRVNTEATRVQVVEDVPAVLTRQELLKRILDEADAAEAPKDRIRALDVYGKYAGYATPAVAVQTNVQVDEGAETSTVSFAALMDSIGESAH